MADLNYGAVHQNSVRTTETARHIGAFLDVQQAHVISAINGYAVATDIWTPTVGGSTTSIVYQAPDASSATTYTIAAVTTVAQLAERFGDLSTALGRDVTEWFTVDQTTAVCTAKNPGITGTFTNAGSITWAHTDTGSSGTDIPVGRMVLLSGIATAAGAVGSYKMRLPAASTTLNPDSNQVITFTPSAGIGAGDQIRLIVRSRYLPRATCTIEVSHNTDLATTLADLVTDANTILDLGIDAGGLGSGFGVVASTGGTTLVLTSDVKGYAFDADMTIVNGASGTMTLTSKVYTTGAPGDIDTDVVPNLLGIVGRGGQSSANSSGAPVVQPLKVGELARCGKVLVVNSQSPAVNDVVWMDPATGLLYNAGASGYIPLPNDKARWTGDNQTGYAGVWINLL